ncbi:MAG: MFS transporter [Halieaceae bacterium]|nr:MFS transporter [Halieaceae bacterium]
MKKQSILRLACIGGGINLLWLTPLKLFNLLPNSPTLIFLLIFINSALNVFFVIMRTISIHSMVVDVADEQELESWQRQEGVMFAGAFFAGKLMIGFGYLFGGPFLDAIGLESGMLPGEAPTTTMWGLGLALGPGLGTAMLLCAFLAYRLNLSQNRFLETQATLKKKGTNLPNK